MAPIWKLSKLTWILVKTTAPESASRNVNIQCAFAIQSQAKIQDNSEWKSDFVSTLLMGNKKIIL